MKLTAQQVYTKLLKEDNLLQIRGKIGFILGNVKIIVKTRDVLGNLIQEWLQGWLEYNKIDYQTNPNTQMPPDFFLDPENLEKNLLEVKAFNWEATPGFDIADFGMYAEEIKNFPFMLDVDYLIFGYAMESDGTVRIKDLWLKKVWEMTSASKNWPLKLQVKRNVVQKMRPSTWYSTQSKFKTFESMEDFISAVEETVHQNPATRNKSGTWLVEFKRNYKKYYGKDINVPRWSDIKSKYQPE